MRRDIEFLSGGVTLRGFFEVPDGADGPVPVICFAHGFSGFRPTYPIRVWRMRSGRPERRNAASKLVRAQRDWDHACRLTL
jgi:hypothetical protein